MIILAILILLAPALIGMLLYERFKGYELIWRKRIELLFSFAFIINLVGYAVLWLRGYEYLVWSWDDNFTMHIIPFAAQYMITALVTAVALAYIFTLVRIGKKK